MGFFSRLFPTREKAARKALEVLEEMLLREGPDVTFSFMLNQDDLMEETFTMDLVGPQGPVHHEYIAFMKKFQAQFEEKHPELRAHKKEPIQLSSGVTLDPYDIESLIKSLRKPA